MSGRKNRLVKYQNITSGNMASASITSAVTNVEGLDNIGLQFTWVGTAPIGSFTVEISIDYAQDYLGNVTNAGTWNTLAISPAVNATGAASDSAFIALNQLPAPWVRTKYTKTSGTGTLQGYITGKML